MTEQRKTIAEQLTGAKETINKRNTEEAAPEKTEYKCSVAAHAALGPGQRCAVCSYPGKL